MPTEHRSENPAPRTEGLALVVGAGPAGLMAADALARAGWNVVVAEAKPSVGRKLLMAGKSGLNLTKDEDLGTFIQHYGQSASRLQDALTAFGPVQVQKWAKDLGQDVFTGTSGRVFPRAMKASPLLRAWLAELAGFGVDIRANWRLTGWRSGTARFQTPSGDQTLHPAVTVLALGGASWPRLGSDGNWTRQFESHGVKVAKLKPANAGLTVAWSSHMARHFGAPVKGAALKVGKKCVRAEFVVTRNGLEGSGIYAVSGAVRDGGELYLDLLPDWSVQRVVNAIGRPRGKASLSNHLRKTLRLEGVRRALLLEFASSQTDVSAIAPLVKYLPIRHQGLRPLAEAISTAGGVDWSDVGRNYMLKKMPGVFVAGEMLDWEAPTGGYLLTACLATGLAAGTAAAQWPEHAKSHPRAPAVPSEVNPR